MSLALALDSSSKLPHNFCAFYSPSWLSFLTEYKCVSSQNSDPMSMIPQLPLGGCRRDTWASSLVLVPYQMPSCTSILVTSVIIIFIPTIWIRPQNSKKSSSVNREKLAKRLSLKLKKRKVDEFYFEYFSPLSPGLKTFPELFWIPVHVLVFLLIDTYLHTPVLPFSVLFLGMCSAIQKASHLPARCL